MSFKLYHWDCTIAKCTKENIEQSSCQHMIVVCEKEKRYFIPLNHIEAGYRPLILQELQFRAETSRFPAIGSEINIDF